MPIGENVLATQLYCHRAVLHMSSVVDKVKFYFQHVVLRVNDCFTYISCYLHVSQVKAELDSVQEFKAKAEKLFTEVETERAAFAEERRGYEDRLNKMGVELNASLSTEHKLLDENKALQIWGEKPNSQAELEKKRADEAVAQAMALKKDTKLRVSKAVEEWRASPAFDAIAQEAYVLAMSEITKFIKQQRPDWDTAFLVDAQKEQEKEMEQLLDAAEA